MKDEKVNTETKRTEGGEGEEERGVQRGRG